MSIRTAPKMPPRKARAKVFMRDPGRLSGERRPSAAGGGLPFAAGTALSAARIRTWGRCSPGRIGTAGRRRTRLGWRPGRRPAWGKSGSRRCKTLPGRWCRCRGTFASCRSWWISLVARRRDVIDGLTFGAARRSQQAFATSGLRVCRTGRASRPSRPRRAPRRVEPARGRSSSPVPTVRSWVRTLARLKETVGRKSLEAGSVVDDRARQRRHGAVAQD
jgi:hypothetical protein